MKPIRRTFDIYTFDDNGDRVIAFVEPELAEKFEAAVDEGTKWRIFPSVTVREDRVTKNRYRFA